MILHRKARRRPRPDATTRNELIGIPITRSFNDLSDRRMIKMDIFEAIRTRRSIRKYDRNRDVESEKLLACLEAARWAPSASNKQPWHFIIVRNRERREELAKLHPHGKFMAESPVVVVVLGDPQKHQKYFRCDPPIATQNFLLAAHAQGLGTCWMGVIDSPFEEQIRKLLGVPEALRIICTVSVGYPAEKPEKTRQPLEDLVSYETFGLATHA